VKTTTSFSLVSSLAIVLLAAGPRGLAQQPTESSQPSPVTVPTRPANPAYKGEPGKQRPEITFAPVNRTVTVKLQVQDPNGYFLPNIRRENFAVYEDGVRQKNVTVEIEHAPVSVALLTEFGSRYHELNKVLGMEVPLIGKQLLEVIGRDDKVSIFKYDAKLDTLADFNQGHETLDQVFDHLTPPPSSEANFYDALFETLNRMRDVAGRRAIIAVSSGVDTFSKTSFEQLVEAARNSATPIYTIGLLHPMQREAAVYGAAAPFARIDWTAAEKRLETLAKVSGGRAYELQSDADVPAVYDDIMENLRVRYVVTYVSSNTATAGPPRTIRIDLIDPKTGEALRIRDATGKIVASKVFVQESYQPTGTAAGG
jgi:Ca-activated chloride channel family protein